MIFAGSFGDPGKVCYLCRMEIRKVIRLPLGAYRVKHLRLVEELLPVRLTGAERELLAALLGEPRGNPLGGGARARVKAQLGLTKQTFSNRLKGLLEKGYVYADPGSGLLLIREYLYPGDGAQAYRVQLEVACSG